MAHQDKLIIRNGGFMNSFRVGATSRLVLFMLAASAAVFLSAHPSRTQTQTPNTKTRSATTWEWSDDGWRMRVEIHGKAKFTEDYSDISSLSEDGFVRIEEDHNGESRRLDVKRDEGGQLLRKYIVNGEPRALDDKGRKWVAELLLTAVRQGAIDVDKRVQTIVRQRGVNGMLEEIGNISGDYGKRIYFQALLKNENLSRADLQKALEAAGAQISSDYERANLLKNTAEIFLDDSTLRNTFFQSIAAIHSDYERRGALSALLKRKNLSEQVLSQVLETAASISSDYEKATFLLEASNMYTGDTRLRSAFLKTVETIKSDHERGRVLSALLKNKQIG
jgi:hypothetical protein